MMTKRFYVSILFVLFFCFSLQVVNAFGVTAPYWKENPLTLQPGESREINFLLQNMVDENDVTTMVKIEQGQEYVRFKEQKTEYVVPSKTKDIPVSIIVTVPTTAKVGEVLPVVVSFKNRQNEESQQVTLGLGISKTFNIIVSAESAPDQSKEPAITQSFAESTISVPVQATGALIVIVLVAIVWIVLKKMKRHKGKEDSNNAQW